MSRASVGINGYGWTLVFKESLNNATLRSSPRGFFNLPPFPIATTMRVYVSSYTAGALADLLVNPGFDDPDAAFGPRYGVWNFRAVFGVNFSRYVSVGFHLAAPLPGQGTRGTWLSTYPPRCCVVIGRCTNTTLDYQIFVSCLGAL